jgi:hypothetical protein
MLISKIGAVRLVDCGLKSAEVVARLLCWLKVYTVQHFNFSKIQLSRGQQNSPIIYTVMRPIT